MKYLTEKFKEPKSLLYLALTVGALLTILQVTVSVDLYRDSANVYSFMARSLAAGNIRDAFHPAIPSLNILLAHPFTLAGLRPEQSLGLVSCLFYLFSIPFLYLLLKEFLPEQHAGVGTLLYAFAPKVIRFSCSAIIDSGKLFFLISALYFALRLIRGKFRSCALALGFGAMLGGLSLARSEGIGSALILAGCVAVYYVIDILRQKKLPPILPVLTAAAAFLLLLASRVYLNYRTCGKFIYDLRISNGINRIIAKLTGAATAVAAAPTRQDGTSWMHLLNQNLRGAYEVYLFFAIIGIIIFILAVRWKNCNKIYPDKQIPSFVKWDSFYLVFAACILGNILIFKLAHISAYRYFLLDIPLLMVFTLIGLHWSWCWCAKFIPVPLLYLTIAVVFFFQIENGAENFFSKSSRRRYDAGIYVGKLLDAEHNTGRVWFQTACIEWYYSGMRRAFPIEQPQPDPRTFRDFEYVLLEADEHDIKVIEARKDLREIPLPQEYRIRLFQRI